MNLRNQTINYDNIDYNWFYQKKYKKLPKIHYFMTLVAVIAAGILDILISTAFLSWAYCGLLSFLVGEEFYISGILAAILWVAIAFGAAHLVRYLSAIRLSQSIVVADTLLEIRNGTPSHNVPRTTQAPTPPQVPATRAALERIAKLKAQGILTEAEAAQMRADVLSGN